MLSGVELAKAVLKAKTRYELLSLGSNDGSIVEGKDGYLNKDDEEVRRCYMRIATKIHPDKLVGFADATKAFQALVRAYELCCKPDLRGDESDDSRDESEGDEDDGDDPAEESGVPPVPKATATGKKQVTARSQRGEGSSSKQHSRKDICYCGRGTRSTPSTGSSVASGSFGCEHLQRAQGPIGVQTAVATNS